MRLSIIIPTYNRAEILQQCLEYLNKQTVQDFEIIIVDDGSTDNTKKMVTKFAKKSPFPVRYIFQQNQKQATARNTGLQKAQGKIVLFLGDDILALPKLVEEHLSIHEHFHEDNIAVLGHTTWDASLKITPYMKFLEWSGWQFNYQKINQLEPFKTFEEYKDHEFNGKFLPPQKQHWFFYTSNLSFKKNLLTQEAFNENFKAYGWEDIELGLRLTQKHQLHLFYNNDARCYHSHPQEETELKSKMQTLAQSLKYAPELKPKWWKILFFKFILIFPVLNLIKKTCPYNWYLWVKAKQMFYRGLKLGA